MNYESHESRTASRPETHPRPSILGLVGEVCLRLGWPGHLSRSQGAPTPREKPGRMGLLKNPAFLRFSPGWAAGRGNRSDIAQLLVYASTVVS